jgi:DNA-binding MarR family transcriptional regulator
MPAKTSSSSDELTPRGDPTTSSIAAALLSVSRATNQVKAHETLCRRAGVDLDRSGGALLYSLFAEGENVRVTDLAERLGVDSPGVTRKVQQLEREGLVCRSADPDDGRATRLGLTPAGRRSIESLLCAREGWLHGVLQGWSEADRRAFAKLLALFATTIANEGDDTGGS